MLAKGEPVDRRKDQARAAEDLNRSHLGFFHTDRTRLSKP
jgi:hypothetical protein